LIEVIGQKLSTLTGIKILHDSTLDRSFLSFLLKKQNEQSEPSFDW